MTCSALVLFSFHEGRLHYPSTETESAFSWTYTCTRTLLRLEIRVVRDFAIIHKLVFREWWLILDPLDELYMSTKSVNRTEHISAVVVCIYIYRERERERDIHISQYVCICTIYYFVCLPIANAM